MKFVAKNRRNRIAAYGTEQDWRSLCKQVKSRDRYHCTRCGITESESLHKYGKYLEIHHIIPVSRGGKSCLYNLKSLCCKCHSLQPGHSHLHKGL